ncbi:hypothetical protein [Niallia nealsonii]|uniref:Beta-carotene 15,15'-monooxygenase n=1 Tax=Niallia nealsonii TaxID=115979 RepID=A0A2N0Z1T1_9BACI|nr:hypothetical protein [Niallia nealsonii]PKG23462.1 hypothetical protein CWS01_11795 [Niallia nealsonii]
MWALPKQRFGWLCVLLAAVLSSNILIYHVDFLPQLPKEVVFGSLLDFLITIPLIIYFLIIRKRYSLRYLFYVVIASYAAALFIIPQHYFSSFHLVRYLIFAGEAAFLLVELYIVFQFIKKLVPIIKSYRTNRMDIPIFSSRLEKAINIHIKSSRFIEMMVSEISMVYYCFFSWRSKPLVIQDGKAFTYHKKTSAIAFYVMLIHALIIESVGFHFLLHAWTEVAAVIAIALNIYTLIYLVAEMQSIKLCPFIITNNHVHLQIGLTKKMTVPLGAIKSVRSYQGPEKIAKNEKKHLLEAMLPDFIQEKPTVEIEFYHLEVAKFMYGFKKQIKKVHLRPDYPKEFIAAIYTKLEEAKRNIE